MLTNKDLTEFELTRGFSKWWEDEGSAFLPSQEELLTALLNNSVNNSDAFRSNLITSYYYLIIKRLCRIAWANGGYTATNTDTPEKLTTNQRDN